jgi:hypothetical protein
MKEMQ